MKRLGAALLFVACCGPTVDPTTTTPSSILLTLVDTSPIVVRGSTTRVRATIGAVNDPGLEIHLTIASLPDGVTASAVNWKPTDPQPSLTITAAPDAPEADLPFSLSATSDGELLGTASGRLAVSELTGSLDPTFGQGGVFAPDVGVELHVVGMRQQADGKWILVGYDRNAALQIVAFLVRLTPNGEIDAAFGQDGLLEVLPNDHATATSLDSVAFAPDDRIAIGVERASDDVVIELDKDGNILSNATTTNAPKTLAWDGAAFVVGSPNTIERLGTPTTSASPLFDVAALAPSTTGGVWAYGLPPLGVTRYDTPALTASWTRALPGPQGGTLGASILDVDATGRALVALVDAEVARLLPDGTFDATWGTAGVAPLLGGDAAGTWVHELSSGAALVIGSFTTGGAFVTELSPTGASIPFGTYGRTLLCPKCAADTAAVDLAEKRVCVAEEPVGTAPFVACYLLAP